MCTSKSLCLLKLFIIILKVSNVLAEYLPEDATLNFVGLATKYGHPSRQYDAITEDGYILRVYRLPGRSKIPILLTHGVMDSSDTWIARGNTSMAITLANKGYDVWLANTRGNRYSRRHLHLNPNTDPAFWRFSFHEMGYYDLPAMIDLILKETGANKLTAIGHSQGNTIYYVLGSERKEYNSKINVMIALAPIAYLHNTPPPVSTIMELYPLIKPLVKNLGIHEIVGDNTILGQFMHLFCSTPGFGYSVCINGLLFAVMGFDSEELEPEFARAFAANYPAGTSAQSLLHFMQVSLSKKFGRYDYGSKINRRVYSATKPPKYQLKKITIPIALLAARNDRLSTIPDVAILRRRLPNVVYYLENPRRIMNHADYMLGRNMHMYLFPYVFQVLRENNHLVD